MFLRLVSTRQGIPYHSNDHTFGERLMKECMHRINPFPDSTSTPTLNLRNKTLHFTPHGIEEKPFDKMDGLTYQLPYEYEPSATAPMFQKFLDRILPDKGVQHLIAQYIAYIFMPHLRLQKLMFLHDNGGGETGKSTLVEIIEKLIGEDRCSAVPLYDLTTSENHRATLAVKLLNACKENNPKMNFEVFKSLAAREALTAKNPYKDPFTMRKYATCLFAMNSLPNAENTHAFHRRLIIVPFTQDKITKEERILDLASIIIHKEAAGVLNFVIEGARSLLANGNFIIPEVVIQAGLEYKTESCSAAMFMSHNGYEPGDECIITAQTLHNTYVEQYKGSKEYMLSDRTFYKRLRGLGYTVDKHGKKKTLMIHYNQDKDDDTKCTDENF